MKKGFFLTVMALFICLSASAQLKVFSNFADNENVMYASTSQTILSKLVCNALFNKANINGLDLSNGLRFDNISVLVCEDANLSEKIQKDAMKNIKSEKLTEMYNQTEKGGFIRAYTREKNGRIYNFVVVIAEKNNTIVAQLMGDFNAETIKNALNSVAESN